MRGTLGLVALSSSQQGRRAVGGQPAQRFFLYPNELYRVPSAYRQVRTRCGIAHISHQGKDTCEHLAQIQDVTPSAQSCEECLRSGSRWVHLRLCLTCGHVGCCDSSPNKHATKHFNTTHHPIIQSFEKGKIGAGVMWIRCWSKVA